MNRILIIPLAFLLLAGLGAAGSGSQANASDTGRFFYSGDGQLQLFSAKTGRGFGGIYRQGAQNYDSTSLLAICRVFGAPCSSRQMHLSLRLIEFIDFLEDRLRPGARITITSGYRSPTYNTKLRNRGALVAKASLHQYGMAADLKIEGVPAERIWEFVKDLGFGGTGYYHGDTVHIDVGPARWWDEKTSGVDKGISNDNKLIGLVSDYDIYRPGEMIMLRFIRMTAFPIGVAATFTLDRRSARDPARAVTHFRPIFKVPLQGSCPQFADIRQMDSIRWQLPADLPPGSYAIRARFCNKTWPDMPAKIKTPDFKVDVLE